MSTPVKSVTFRDPVPNSFGGRKTTDRHFDAQGHKLELEVDLLNRLVRLERDDQVCVVVPFENLVSFEPAEQDLLITEGAPEGVVDALLALGYRPERKLKLRLVSGPDHTREYQTYPDCDHPKGSQTCLLCGAVPDSEEDLQDLEAKASAAGEQLAAMKSGTEPGELHAAVEKLAEKIAEPGGKPDLVGCNHDVPTEGCPVCDLPDDLEETEELAPAAPTDALVNPQPATERKLTKAERKALKKKGGK